MPRAKKTDRIKKRPESVQDIQQDHEQFLLAFEKPTQIYRFLRARQILAPTFLHRALLYMPQRCSRTNGRREKFSVNDMLIKAQSNDNNLLQPENKNDNDLHVTVASLMLDPMKKDSRFIHGRKHIDRIDVEVVLVRNILNKRKDVDQAGDEKSYGVIETPVNPKSKSDGSYFIDEEDMCIILSSDELEGSASVKASTKSLALKFRLRKVSSDTNESDGSASMSSDEDSEEESAGHHKKKEKSGEEDSEEEDDPAGISLKNLQSGPRKRKSRYSTSRAKKPQAEDDERNTRSRESKSDPEKKPRLHNQSYRPPFIKTNASLNNKVLAEVELLLFDSEFKCQAGSGNYELIVAKKDEVKLDYKRKAVWESFNGGEEVKVYSTFSTPTLKFSLKWVESSRYGPFSNLVEDEDMTYSVLQRCTRTSCQNLTNGESGENPPLKEVDVVEYRKTKLNVKERLNFIFENGCDGITSDRVVYQFMYNNNSQQQTETRDDFMCPWCQLNCMTLYGLMKHLKLCHPRFLFRYSQQAKGTVIVVTVNECYDGSYAGNPRNIFCQPGMAFSRRGPVRRIPVTDVLVYKPDRTTDPSVSLADLLEKEDIEALEPTQMSSGHRRLYFHSLTTLPVRPCEFDVDSEDEDAEPDWLFGHTKRMIDEFTDVNEGEKAVMKLWNLHVMRNACISDTQIEGESMKFIDKNIGHLVAHSLRKNLLLHFICLVDFGVLKTSNVLTLMKYFDDAKEKYRRCKGKDIGNSPDISAPDFPEPDLLPRFKKLKCLMNGVDS